MPAIRHWTVTQTRSVDVVANDEIDAARIAGAAFANGQNSDNCVINGPKGVWGNTDGPIKSVELDVKEGWY